MGYLGFFLFIVWEREKGIICFNFFSFRNNIYKIEGDFRVYLFFWFIVFIFC